MTFYAHADRRRSGPPPGSPYPKDGRTKLFTLAPSQDVRLFGPEIDVVDTREFQRLAGIRQLGTSHYALRSALHTRFEHSLGTLRNAQRVIDAVESNPFALYMVPVQPKARRLSRLAALLHDLPHMPYGYTLEDELHLFPRHDCDDARWKALFEQGGIAEALKAAQSAGDLEADERDELGRVLKAKTDHEVAKLQFPFVADIVGNTVCADLLDYVVRDLEASGMPVALGDRFLTYFIITKPRVGRSGVGDDDRRMALRLWKRGMPRPDVESEVIKLLTYRYELAERVYFHHAKNAASVMIGRAVQELGLHEADPAGSGQAASPSIRMLFTSAPPDASALPISDDLLLRLLAVPTINDTLGVAVTRDEHRRELAAKLGRDLIARRLYKVGYLTTRAERGHTVHAITERYEQPSERRALENRLAEQMGLESGDVLVHIPAEKMMEKLAAVRVERFDGSITTLDEWDRGRSHRIQALNEAHHLLWRLLVFVRPADDKLSTLRRRQMLAAVCADEFEAENLYDLGVEFPSGWADARVLPNISWLHQEVARQLSIYDGYDVPDLDRVAHTAATARPLGRAGSQHVSIAEIRTIWLEALRASAGGGATRRRRTPRRGRGTT